MDTVKIVVRILSFVILIVGAIYLHRYVKQELTKRDEEINFYKTKEIKDSIVLRQYIRQQQELAFQYEDSIRTLKINLIKAQNAKSRKTTIRAISLLPTATTQYRDSLWTEEWARKDTFPY